MTCIRSARSTHIHKMFKLPDGTLRLIVQGQVRLQLDEVLETQPYIKARVPASADELTSDDDNLEIDALQRNIKNNFQQVVSLSPLLSDDLQALAGNIYRAREARRLHRLWPDDASRRRLNSRCWARSTCVSGWRR